MHLSGVGNMNRILLLLVVLLALPSTAFAYIDGASGSVILQTFIGLIAGAFVWMRKELRYRFTLEEEGLPLSDGGDE